MRELECSGTPVLYIGRTVAEGPRHKKKKRDGPMTCKCEVDRFASNAYLKHLANYTGSRPSW